ncbi:MAG: helix-turn-helix transcriptional regulator [Thermoleophilaceae bacterium]|jgi:transcriptional regulator with XRE-family HTH domain|nr:helix-turn-helix transcriptional regulator [Thermoleophilaceae bacterium]
MTDLRRTDLNLVIEARDAVSTGRGARLRRAALVSQSELGAAIGVTGSAISRWERGSRLPRAAEGAAYARALRRLERVVVNNDESSAATPSLRETSNGRAGPRVPA